MAAALAFGSSPQATGRTDAVVMAAETAHVDALRQADALASSWNPQGHRVGLALSGGGIRSATFCLGVLQAIAQQGWLRRFDYLSTVSGGGYIGAWLSAILHRQVAKPADGDKVKAVEQLISPRDIQTKSDEPVEIAFLRAYSNYLTPRLGLLSADTLAAVVGYLRNLSFNLLLALLTIGLVLAVLHGPVSWLAIHGTRVQWGSATPLTWIVNSLAFPAAIMCAFLLTLQSLDVRSALTEGSDQKLVIRFLRLIQEAYGKILLFGLLLILLLVGMQFESQLAQKRALGLFFLFDLNILVLFMAGGALAYFIVDLARGIVPATEPGSDPIQVAADSMAWLALVTSLVKAFRSFKDEWFRYLVAAMACNLVAFALVSFASELAPVPFLAMVFRGPALAAGLMSLLLIVWLGVVGTTYSDQTREWLSRLVGAVVGLLLVWVLMGAIIVNARPLWLWATLAGSPVAALASPWAWLLGTLGLLGILKLVSDRMRSALAQGLRMLAGLLVVVATWAVATVAFQTALLHLAGQPSAVSAASSFTDIQTDHLNAVSSASAQLQLTRFTATQWLDAPDQVLVDAWPSCALLLAVAVAAFFAFRYIDVNAFSLQNLYRNRLVRCYLGAAHGQQRLAEPFAGFDPRDDLHLSALANQRPFHIFNAALNLTQGDDLAWQQRKAASFTFTPLDSGFWLNSAGLSGLADKKTIQGGYAPTDGYASEPVSWGSTSKGVLLGSMMATSGAAVSSQMGFASSGLLAFVLTLLNVRLGRWFPNPALDSSPDTLEQRSPRFAAWWFLRELLGRTDEKSRWVYLSDGGHFENLGIYELVRRRCRYMVAVDAGADPGMSFSDLGNAVRKCRVDFGVEVRIDLSGLSPGAPGERPLSSSVTGKVDYPPSGQEPGFTGDILYIKLGLPSGMGNLPADILAFAKEEPRFPHQPTTDQWFTESQFESYRQLGYLIGGDALKKGAGMFAQVDFSPPPAAGPAPHGGTGAPARGGS